MRGAVEQPLHEALNSQSRQLIVKVANLLTEGGTQALYTLMKFLS